MRLVATPTFGVSAVAIMFFFRTGRSLLPRLASWGLRQASERVSLKRCAVEKVGRCVVMELVSENKENRLDLEFLKDFNRALDQAERYAYRYYYMIFLIFCVCVCVCMHAVVFYSYEDASCIVTISDGKHYSLGLDLELVSGGSGVDVVQYIFNVQKLYSRLLTFPLVTVAAANGN